jgi:hypothetical protein
LPAEVAATPFNCPATLNELVTAGAARPAARAGPVPALAAATSRQALPRVVALAVINDARTDSPRLSPGYGGPMAMIIGARPPDRIDPHWGHKAGAAGTGPAAAVTPPGRSPPATGPRAPIGRKE